ncbi:MAG: translocation/assembly module TamB domain-containing protein [Desulfobacterales bacterium]|uniref:Translocation/assembly module TamB domain-containing protein n=1 Tax=Candidatus Desulfatibia vada TaxID=2841696 RepID=A0A8J6P0X2_9BACT|nr:translocation/assembly module TamB domain-containing protein [Candidatus Desulfatibia vada]MBL6971225.1 translocation/assembly module TamB domain-containing protein [Desulfobacterales bacterium]
MKRVKVLGKIAAAILLSVIVIVAAIAAYLNTGHARRLILDRINGAIPGAVTLENIRFSLLAGSVDLHNPVILNPSGEKLAGCTRLYADIEWTALLHQTLAVTDLLIEYPWAKLRLDTSGRLNLMQALLPPKSDPVKTPPRPALPAGILGAVVKSARISNGRLQFTADRQQAHLELKEIDLKANADILKKTGQLKLSTRSGEFQSPRFKTTLDLLKVATTFDNNRLDPLTAELRTSLGSIVVTGRIDRLAETPVADLALNLMVDLAALKSAAGFEKAFGGLITAGGTVRGSMGNPQLNLHGDYNGGSLAGLRVDRAKMGMQLKDRIIRINELSAQAASGSLHLTATADLATAFAEGFLSPHRDLDAVSYQLQLKSQAMNLARLTAAGDKINGTLNATLDLKGRGVQPNMLSAQSSLDLSADKFSLATKEAAADIRLHARIALEKGTAIIKTLSTDIGNIRIEGQGQLELESKTVDARLTVDAPDLKHNLSPLGIFDAGGALHVDARLSGSVSKPYFEAAVQGSSLTFNAYRLGNLTARLDWHDGSLRMDPLTLQNRSSALDLTGSVRLLTPGTRNVLADPLVDIRINAPRLVIEDFMNRFKGKFSLAAQLKGPLTRPQGMITAAGENLAFNAVNIATATLELLLEDEKVKISSLQIGLTPQDTISGSGWIAYDTRFGLRLASQGVDLTRIAWLRQHQMVEGTCVFAITGRGRLDDPEVEGNFTVKNVKLNQTPLDDFQLRVNVRNMLARISGNLDFTFDGTYDVRQKDFTLNVACRRTDLAPYFSLLGRKDFRGRLTGTLNAAGNARALARISGTADLADLELFFYDKQLFRTSGANITFKDQTLQIQGMHLVLLEDGFLDLQGHASYSGPLNFQAAGQIPLSVLRPFSQDLSDLSGRLAVKARIGGTKTSPTANIDIGLEQVGLTIPVLTQRLQNLSGRLHITQNQIQIDDVTAQLDTGRLQLAGRIELANFRPRSVSADFKARTLPVRIPEMMDLLVDADLNIAGTTDKSGIQGEVVILEGLYYKDFKLNLLETITKKQRAQPTPPQISSRPLLKNMSLDVALNARSPFRVENNVARLEIQPDLRLGGRLEAPVIVGRANITKGFVRYSKKKFDITRGVVDFSNPYKTEPNVDIESQTRVRSWDVFLAISGTPDQLLFSLRSDPAEEDNDILSLLLVGRTSRELISNEKGVSQSTERILADMVAATFGEDIKHATGLDIFELSGSGSDNVKLSLGKELSRRMTVKYEAGAKAGQMIQLAIAEYKLLENVVVNGFQDIRGFFGGEFQFQMDFW